ncbi:hypothetical protein B5V46_09495 [Rhodovulum sp. MB263]|nr:hypothetical protein B5V46_09495 [Rhodovulum sp. MB263]
MSMARTCLTDLPSFRTHNRDRRMKTLTGLFCNLPLMAHLDASLRKILTVYGGRGLRRLPHDPRRGTGKRSGGRRCAHPLVLHRQKIVIRMQPKPEPLSFAAAAR